MQNNQIPEPVDDVIQEWVKAAVAETDEDYLLNVKYYED